jgi:ElaA protein
MVHYAKDLSEWGRCAMINFQVCSFSELSVQQLYEILLLRSQVFVEEQQCTLPDVDGEDPVAMHLLGKEAGQLVAYLRVFLPNNTQNKIVFGRVVTAAVARQKGYGKALMQALLDYCAAHYSGVTIKCSAQQYLQKFYEGFGFVAYGDFYEEAGIVHVAMELKPRQSQTSAKTQYIGPAKA